MEPPAPQVGAALRTMFLSWVFSKPISWTRRGALPVEAVDRPSGGSTRAAPVAIRAPGRLADVRPAPHSDRKSPFSIQKVLSRPLIGIRPGERSLRDVGSSRR